MTALVEFTVPQDWDPNPFFYGSFRDPRMGLRPRSLTAAYNPSQPRDERGRWTSGGGVGPTTVEPVAISNTPQWEGATDRPFRDHQFVADQLWEAIGGNDYDQSAQPRLHPERYIDRRVVNPNPGAWPGPLLRSGEVETRIRERAGEPPTLYDVTPLLKGERWDSYPLEQIEPNSMGEGEGPGPLRIVPGSERPLPAVFRVMDEREYRQAMDRGFIQSDERMNIVAGEGTVASVQSTGMFYAPWGATSGPQDAQARIVRIRVDPADGWETGTDTYVKTSQPVPVDRIEAVTVPFTKEEANREVPPGLTAAFNPNQPRDERGRWTEAPGYEGTHRPAGPDYGAPMNDPESMTPDLLAHPEWYSTGLDDVDDECMTAIRRAVKGGPDTDIKIYRGVPKDVTEINPGDWVTPSRTYARIHAEGNLGTVYDPDTGQDVPVESHVLSETAKAGDLWFEGNSIAEWGWSPNLTAAYNPRQPRIPAGQPGGGRWAPKGGAGWAGVDGLLYVGFTPGREREVRAALKRAVGPLQKVALRDVEYYDQRVLDFLGGMPRGSSAHILAAYDSDREALMVGSDAFEPGAQRDYDVSTFLSTIQPGANWHSRADKRTALEATIAHEVGHAADNALTDNDRLEVFYRLSDTLRVPRPSYEGDPTLSSAEDWVRTNQDLISWEVSGYASTTDWEILAECWAEYRTDDDPRPAALAVGHAFEEFLGGGVTASAFERIAEVRARLDEAEREVAALVDDFRYNPAQPRDRRGRWTSRGLGQINLGEVVDIDGFADEDVERIRQALAGASGWAFAHVDHVQTVRYATEEDFAADYPQTQALADYNANTGEIRLGEEAFSVWHTNEHEASNLQALTSKDNWYAPCGEADGLTATLTHEVGHAVNYTLSRTSAGDVARMKALRAIGEVAGIGKPMDVGDVAVDEWVTANRAAITQTISGIAGMNGHELLAEAWTEYILSDNPRPAALRAGQAMEQELSFAEYQRKHSRTASALLAAYNPNQPRIPAGQPGGGRWRPKGGWSGAGVGTPAEWASRVDILLHPLADHGIKDMEKRVEEALVTAAGTTTKIDLAEVIVSTTRAMPGSNLGAVLGQYGRSEKSIYLNDVVFSPAISENHAKDSANWEKGENFDVPTSVTNDGLKVTLAHEVGHAADFTLTPDQREEMFNGLADSIGVARPVTTVAWWVADHQIEVTKALSYYAAHGDSETVAEAWCEYVLNDNPRPAARAIGRYIERALGPDSVTASAFRYNPGQPRDWHGRWTSFAAALTVPPHYADLGPKAQAAVDARLARYGLTPQALDDEIEAVIAPGGTLDKDLVAQGAKWYPDAKKYAAGLGEKYGVTLDQAIAVIAATSPRMLWWQNKDAARHILQEMGKYPTDMPARDVANRIGGALRDNMTPAIEIARGAEIATTLTGPKRRSFFNNIRYPGQTDTVTLDTRMLRVPMRATKTPGEHEIMDLDSAYGWLTSAEASTGGAGYVALAESVRRVAAKHDLPPDTVQAAYWIAIGGD